MDSEIEKKLWQAADQLRANAKFPANEYFLPVMGLIFLKYADEKFEATQKRFSQKYKNAKLLSKEHFQAEGAFFLPDNSRYNNLLSIPTGEKIGLAINEAMKAIESENDALKDTLPKVYNRLENDILQNLLKLFSELQLDTGNDTIGRVYEYFLSEFASTAGKKGGEFFTPTSIVRLIVEIMEPFEGRILDPACGSGGMFVQSARFVDNHKKNGRESSELLSIYGQEKIEETVRLAKLNLAVHGMEGDIRSANSYYADEFKSIQFDYILANPPFNVNGVDKERIKTDPRFAQGLPTNDNGNYIWIEMFLNKLSQNGRAGFVMANSASDAGGSEKDIRKKIIESGAVDCMISVGSNFFYTVTLPCSLWFFDRGKPKDRINKTLFIDARNVFTQVDKAHREFTNLQIEYLGNIARLARSEEPVYHDGSRELTLSSFPDGKYIDVAGLCKVATIEEIEEKGWSLNPGRYVGVAEVEEDEEEFQAKMQRLTAELYQKFEEGSRLEQVIEHNLKELGFGKEQ